MPARLQMTLGLWFVIEGNRTFRSSHFYMIHDKSPAQDLLVTNTRAFAQMSHFVPDRVHDRVCKAQYVFRVEYTLKSHFNYSF